MMNTFFRLLEVSVSECPLSEIAKSVDGKSKDISALDKPIAFSLSIVENGNLRVAESGEGDKTAARDLTDEERASLKEKTGWDDKQLSKCTIDQDGTILYKTDRHDMEGKESEYGAKYERKTVDINGVKVEGVFPVFDSALDVQLPKDKETASNYMQFKECNEQLKDTVENNPALRSQFSDEQLEEIADGNTPSGYTWHHNEEQGKMQLVKTEDHDRTQGGAAHSGGKSLWGGGDGQNDVATDAARDSDAAASDY